MSDYYTDEDVQAARDVALRSFGVYSGNGALWAAVLDAVAPAIVARAKAEALRELAEAADNTRLPVLDGGSSYIDIPRRADEIERAAREAQS